MEDQGKRLMLAVAIAFGIMMVWTMVFPPEKPPEKKPEEAAQSEVKGGGDGTSVQPVNKGSTASQNAGEPASEAEPVEVVERAPEQLFDFVFDGVEIQFSSYGAALKSWKLLGPRLEDRSGDKVKPQQMVPVQEPGHEFLRVWFSESTFDIPANAEWKGEKVGDKEMRFSWESKDMRVVKEIALHPEDYTAIMQVSVELTGAETAKQALAISFFGSQDPKVADAGMFERVERKWTSACYYDDEIHTRGSKSLADKGEKKRTAEINWGGFDHAYFLVAGAFESTGDERIECNAYPLQGVYGGMRLDLIQDSVEIKSGQPGIRSKIVLYFGPKYMDDVRAAGKLAGFDTKFEASIDLGFLEIIAGPLLWLLNFFQTFVGNWGIAILLLTMVVKALTLPWTHKSMKSMKSMAKLKPQLEKIKEKFKDDRAKQNQETMNLFKTHKVNPMSGCLPMLLQMPIWFALYRALTVAGELYQAPFIPGWIDDLTLPDPYYVMPVLLMGMMFLQTRLTPTTGSGAQQKMLMYGMPIMFGVFSFFFPAGLTLYIFANTCFTALHHLYMKKTDPDPVAAKVAAKAGGVIDVESSEEDAKRSDAASGESSPKKSSGPSKNKKKSGGKSKKKRKR